MGILADEGSNDRMDDLLAADKHPIDIILLFAAAEGTSRRSRRSWRRAPTSASPTSTAKPLSMLAGLNNPSKKEVVEEMLKAKM